MLPDNQSAVSWIRDPLTRDAACRLSTEQSRAEQQADFLRLPREAAVIWLIWLAAQYRITVILCFGKLGAPYL